MAETIQQSRAGESAKRVWSERQEWANKLRKVLSPAGMLLEDGSINQVFFKPKKVIIIDKESGKWGEAENDLLYKGIEKHGIGKWRLISEELLPKWDEQSLRIKASRLMGSQSLARYIGWKGTREEVMKERKINKEIGEKTGCWKSGVLVEDDNGSVQKA
eukprot:CAMPEP_0117651266 /NCGR_PEP_ID=MMETSP0804-20121206/1998_1 /TAXON_ID=1074897 /ORGANISM="Tetraselmis astigmatica, Strain CCMP880" /LENGTH=159 /DNA_ID=CAMNT_0005457227 /DNA_START=248 /DNA_END=723 /DNA_ORIENTATION=-